MMTSINAITRHIRPALPDLSSCLCLHFRFSIASFSFFSYCAAACLTFALHVFLPHNTKSDRYALRSLRASRTDSLSLSAARPQNPVRMGTCKLLHGMLAKFALHAIGNISGPERSIDRKLSSCNYDARARARTSKTHTVHVTKLNSVSLCARVRSCIGNSSHRRNKYSFMNAAAAAPRAHLSFTEIPGCVLERKNYL